ncbi:hypothetical protein ACFPOU_04985 [Massilia jejuensis]|uniref:Uncharacterized protein n=1 Tax=Massilia jejuensis TaxID=648894 RepID=A0ABW0PEY8_9BURK
MKLLPTLFLIGLLMCPVQAARRVGEAQVRTGKGNLPCFTIGDREESRGASPDFQSVTVTAGERILWRMAMPRERTFALSASMCIPYGGRVPALPQTPAAALASGIIYAVQLDTRSGKSATEPVRYVTRFCLARRSNGAMRVRQIDPNEGQGRDLYGCRA